MQTTAKGSPPATIASHSFIAGLTLIAALIAAPKALAQTIGEGSFVGASGHVTSGGVALKRSGGAYKIDFGADFNFDGAPDPKVGFGRSGSYDRSTTLAPLASNSGAQSYSVPPSVKAESYDEIYVWCEKFNVPLGVAKIK